MEYKHNPTLTPCAKELRKNMTKEEKHLWYDYLRHYPVRFLRQKVIDQFIVDFYCHDARLVIEVDGAQHYTVEGLERDIERTSWLKQRGLMVIRIPNQDIWANFNAVCSYIDSVVHERIPR